MLDWVFKKSLSPSWELSERERDEFDDDDDDDVLVMDEKNQQSMEEAFSLDDSGFIFGQKQDSTALSPPEPGSSSNKKPRAGHGNIEQQVSCLVDGCTADLSSCRDYHRRHRVCELHSKTPLVAIHGKDQRFCQQCSRFHSVGEFDEVKRSCRKRLDGHNRRRRKPRGAESSSMYSNHYESFLTNYRGTKLLQFGGSPAYTGRWPPKREKPNQQLHVSVVQQSRVTPSSSREKKFPFLLGPESDEQLISEPLNYPNALSHHNLGQRLTQLVQSNGALSLLSKHTNTSHHTSNYSNPTNFDPHLSLTTGPNSISSSSYGYTNNNHLIGMIHFRTEGFLLENKAPQVLSFSWGE